MKKKPIVVVDLDFEKYRNLEMMLKENLKEVIISREVDKVKGRYVIYGCVVEGRMLEKERLEVLENYMKKGAKGIIFIGFHCVILFLSLIP